MYHKHRRSSVLLSKIFPRISVVRPWFKNISEFFRVLMYVMRV